MSVGDEDLLESEAKSSKAAVDASNLVAGVDNDGVAGLLIAEDGAIALERANRKSFENHTRSKTKAREADPGGLLLENKPRVAAIYRISQGPAA